MDQTAALLRLGLALAIGFLVGTERHWRERGEPAGARTAGIRTYALSGLTGGLSGTLGESMPEAGRALVPALSLAVFAAVFAVFKWREMVAQGDFSVTGVIAALATFLLGILAVLGDPAVAAAGAIALVAVLASRDALHDFVRALRWEELRSAILLLAMTFVILPLLPQKGIGPGELLDLRRIWVLAIVLAGVSFLGYIAVRSLGPGRGPVVAGLAGGLVSSTAVAVTSARETREGASAPVAAAGALAASAVSVARTLVLAVALLGTMPARALAFVAIALVFAGGAVVLAWRSGVLAGTAPQERPGGEGASAKPAGAQYANPFDIGTVLQFAALLGAAAIAGRLAADYFGTTGTNVFALLLGAFDVDAVTLTVTRLARPADAEAPGSGASDALVPVMLAIAANTVAKAIFGAAFGTRTFAAIVAAVSLLALAVGGAALVLLP